MRFNRSDVLSIGMFLSLCVSIYPHVANAYIDLGTGSLIVQSLIATAFGVSLAIKIYWHKLKGFFGFGSREQPKDDERKENTAG